MPGAPFLARILREKWGFAVKRKFDLVVKWKFDLAAKSRSRHLKFRRRDLKPPSEADAGHARSSQSIPPASQKTPDKKSPPHPPHG